MDTKTLKFFREILEQNKREITDSLNRISDSELRDSLQEYTKELSFYDNHPADIGSETYEIGKDIALRKQKMHRNTQIDRALERIEKGGYGICTLCGKKIARSRLEAKPEAELCLKCSQLSEISRGRDMEKRPVEEEVLNYPYNSGEHKDGQSTIFDGEDSWQAVARYNRREDDPSNDTGDEQGIWDEIPSGLVEDIDRISNRYYRNKTQDDNE